MHVCPNGEVGDWRLSDLDSLATFSLPQRRPDKLATQNPFAQDARIHFDEPSHTYTYDGQRVGRSVTGLLHQFSSELDAAAALEAMKRSPEWEIKKATLEEQGLGTSDHDECRDPEERCIISTANAWLTASKLRSHAVWNSSTLALSTLNSSTWVYSRGVQS